MSVLSEASKAFFFEKKKQKTFVSPLSQRPCLILQACVCWQNPRGPG